MRVLIACEYSGVVRDAFARRGHDAWSCDLLPSETRGQHYQGNVLEMFDLPNYGGYDVGQFDLLIAHPPCTWISVSGIHWNKRGRNGLSPSECEAETASAINFVETLWSLPVKRICIENPVGVLSTRSTLGKPTQIIQPYQFNDDASKKTCLWLKDLPKLKPTGYFEPRMVNNLPRWGNQTDSGQNRLGPSETRGKDRAKTYKGIAEAMAEQWGID